VKLAALARKYPAEMPSYFVANADQKTWTLFYHVEEKKFLPVKSGKGKGLLTFREVYSLCRLLQSEVKFKLKEQNFEHWSDKHGWSASYDFEKEQFEMRSQSVCKGLDKVNAELLAAAMQKVVEKKSA